MELKSLLTMSFLFGSLWDSKDISREQDLLPFRRYCTSGYEFHPKMENYNLEKLLVMFRHGARAPTKNVTRFWKDRKCMSCIYSKDENKISDCQKKDCGEGDLTTRGFDQMVGLGRFIRSNYKPLLFDSRIRGENLKTRATKAPRTHASLAGVIKGLTGDTIVENVEVPENDSLKASMTCSLPKKGDIDLLDTQEFMQDNNTFGRSHPRPSERIDHYYASMCSAVKIDCKELSCEIDKIVRYMSAGNDKWRYLAGLASRGRRSRRLVFGDFARELRRDMSEQKQILLYSAHDSSLTAILAGLGIPMDEWPSYASALFIEVWCNGGKQFVRLVLNDRVVRPSEFATEYIPMRSFINLLENMGSSVSARVANPQPMLQSSLDM